MGISLGKATKLGACPLDLDARKFAINRHQLINTELTISSQTHRIVDWINDTILVPSSTAKSPFPNAFRVDVGASKRATLAMNSMQ